MTTSVKMKLAGFAHCEAGLFSELQCGRERLFIQEPPFNCLFPKRSCIPGGVYDVVKLPMGDNEFGWCIINVPDRCAIQFGVLIDDDTEFNQLLVGSELGMEHGKWCVENTKQGMNTLNQWLDGVDTFRLYIDRYYPMNMRRANPGVY